MTKKIRFEGIDFLKFFAIFGVVCLHVAGSYFNVAAQSPTVRLLFQPIRFYYYIGTLSIPLFFCVNGFLILGKENVTYPYILRKVSLLLAPVILWAIFEFIVKLVTEREFVNPVQIGAGFLVQKGLFSQFWFIGALIIVQLTAPILNRLLRDHWTAFRVLLLVFGVVCLVVMFSSYYMRYPVVKSVIQTFRLWTWFFYFMMGAWLRRTQHGSDLSKNTRFCLFVFIVLVVQMGVKAATGCCHSCHRCCHRVPPKLPPSAKQVTIHKLKSLRYTMITRHVTAYIKYIGGFCYGYSLSPDSRTRARS